MESEFTFDISGDELEMFLEDVNENLQVLESGILRLEQKSDPEILNSIFRAAHTLKALAGTVGHQQMADLTHTLENIFDEMREARLSPTQTVADELLATVDTLIALRDEIINQQPGGVDVTALLARLRALKDSNPSLSSEEEETASSPAWPQLMPEQAARIKAAHKAGQSLLKIEVVAAAEAVAPAARLYQVVIALLEEGQIIAQQPAADDLTENDERLWLILATQTEPGDIEYLLGDIDDLAEFRVQLHAPEDANQLDSSPLPSLKKGSPLGEGRNDTRGAGQISDHSSHKPVTTKGSTSDLSKAEGTVRISVERLDALMNLVGELVTSRTRLLQIEDALRSQYGQQGGVGALSQLAPHFSQVVDQLQEEVMRARMLPIASLFNKFPRMVRNMARTAGKQVNLTIEGEATELDRTVIEAINDPLIHLLRNAIDHGLETAEARQAAGKLPTGTVSLTAAAVEGQIVVTVADDGQGIDPDRIRRTAVSSGLFSESDGEIGQLAKNEIIDLIFQPNLSTAAEVTEMSGRGVGLDVVRTNIEELSGSVVVTSEVGRGTTFQLTLPLTLALVQTMLVTVRNTLYALPLTSINGALYLAEAKLNTIKGKPALDWQGQVLPLLDLRQFFDRPHSSANVTSSKNGLRSSDKLTDLTNPATRSPNGVKPSVVLVRWGKHRVGLVVDKIIGQQEIVIKSLSPMLGHTPGLSGATILGDGRIALIIDIPRLINAALRLQRAL